MITPAPVPTLNHFEKHINIKSNHTSEILLK